MQNNIAAFNVDADMGAAVAASALGIGDALYKNLPCGGLFRFHTGNTVFVKLSRGYREAHNASAPTFATGQRTAIFRLS